MKTASELVIEPNLVSNAAFLKMENATDLQAPLHVEIFDGQGVLVKTVESESGAELDLADLQAGVFRVVARSERQIWTGRFVKI